MIDPGGYRIRETVYEGMVTKVYRAVRLSDNAGVILKVLEDYSANRDEHIRLVREYEILRSLKAEYVIKAYDLERQGTMLFLSLEDIGGESLRSVMKRRRLSVKESLETGIKVAEGIGSIHRAGAIHRDINPANIVWNEHTGALRIIDFGTATTVPSQELGQLKAPVTIEGTLAYIPPEQTGRINRPLDYHADLYSLGATLYEMASGRLPFVSEDPLELIYSHIARLPPPLVTVSPDIPAAISEIVSKLMQKNAEDRYQSTRGIVADLDRCLKEWQTSGTIAPFVPGREDVSARFQLAAGLYGRKQDIQALLDAFDRVNDGKSEQVLVSGMPGTGKSSLVRELKTPVTHKKGYVVSGKFDRLMRSAPYSAFSQAFGELVEYLLAENRERRDQWRQRIRDALGKTGRVVTGVIPGLETLIGKQPGLPDVPPAESKFRFDYAFRAFLRAICTKEHPIVFFIDDLQWIDPASVSLMQTLLSDAESTNFLFVGAYRDTEIGKDHPLRTAWPGIGESGIATTRIVTGNLSVEEVTRFVSDTLRCPAARALPLSTIIYEKTQGNPFFVKQFITSLHSDGLLKFSEDSRGWTWNIPAIMARQITDNVVVLMIDRLRKLPQETQETLRLAACLGMRFDLRMLSIVCERDIRETLRHLWTAVEASLVTPLEDGYLLAGKEIRDELAAPRSYRFIHDRVQQAAYALIEPDDRGAVHARIGKLLLGGLSGQQAQEQLFTIVGQLNRGLACITDTAGKLRVAELNARVGRKAKESGAFSISLEHYVTALGLLPEQEWNERYEFMLSVHLDAAEAAYSSAEFETMERIAATALRKSRSLLDTAKIQGIRIRTLIARNMQREAIALGLNVLASMGITIPENPGMPEIEADLKEAQKALAGKSMKELLDLPQMSDPLKCASTIILLDITSAAFHVAPPLFSVIGARGVILSARYGNSRASCVMYAIYAIVVSGLGDIDAADRLADLALELLEKFNATELKATVFEGVYEFIKPWKIPFREVEPRYVECRDAGFETGDIEFAFYCEGNLGFYGLHFSGKDIRVLEREWARHIAAMDKYRHRVGIYQHRAVWQTLQNLTGISGESTLLAGSAFDERKAFQDLARLKDMAALAVILGLKLMLGVLFETGRQAVEYADEMNKYLGSLGASLLQAVFTFYDSLARLAVYTQASPEDKKMYLEKVRASLKKMKTWSSHCPENFLHFYQLTEAEVARVEGRDSDAMHLYEESIRSARNQQLVQYEALAGEIAARFYRSRGFPEITRLYMTTAYHAYRAWGAERKVRDIREKYPALLVATRWGTMGGITAELIDIASLMKASQAISGEIVTENLLGTLMRILTENAGAQASSLLLSEQGFLVVRAYRRTVNGDRTAVMSVPAEKSGMVPLSLVNYVFRTGSSVVLNDAFSEGPFRDDEYITRNKVRSVLCVALQYKKERIGILYLENNLLSGAFTSERHRMTELLASQAAISLVNARLYDDLKHENAERIVAQENLRKSQEQLQAIMDNSPASIYLKDVSGRYLLANRQFHQLFVPGQEHLQGKTDFDLFPAETAAKLRKNDEQVLLTGKPKTFEESLEIGGKKHTYISLKFLLRGSDNKTYAVCGLLTDITERKEMEEHIRYLGFHDVLTSLYNRAYFEEELRRLNTGRELPLSIILGDINNLKLTNDMFGHEEGDLLLQKVARSIREACRENDVAARWGGDEFALLLPRTDLGTAERIARRIQEKNDTVFGEDRWRASIALGIATISNAAQNIETILKQAEERMYKSKIVESRADQERIIASIQDRLDRMDTETQAHTKRMQMLTERLGRALALSPRQLEELSLLARLHDIGKIAIPDNIIRKPGHLTPGEWAAVKKHPEAGYRIARSFDRLISIAEAIRAHHERWDGRGYPRGLVDDEIPLLARILSIVDTYDVMVYGRAYERPVPESEALRELERNAGSQFDPDLVKVFAQILRSEELLKR